MQTLSPIYLRLFGASPISQRKLAESCEQSEVKMRMREISLPQQRTT